MKQISILFLLSVIISLVSCQTCTLRNQTSVEAFPSLHQCYIYTSATCCTSLHDMEVSNYLDTLVSEPCKEKFDEMTQFACYGCYGFESMYTNKTDKTIKLCKGFAERVWGGDLNKPSNQYDNCGLGIEGRIITQSQFFQNAYQFFALVKPAFFEDYKIIIVDTDCFESSINMKMPTMILISLILINLIF